MISQATADPALLGPILGTAVGLLVFGAIAFKQIKKYIDEQVQAAEKVSAEKITNLELRIRQLEHSDRGTRQKMIAYAAELLEGGNAAEIARKLMEAATHYDEIKP